MDLFSLSDAGPVLHEGGIIFKVEFHPLADESRVDDVESHEDLLSIREAFDRLFGIDPNMTVEELEDSRQMRKMLHSFWRDTPASHRQNEAVSGESSNTKRKRSFTQVQSQPADAHSFKDCGDALDCEGMSKAAKGCGAAACEHQA